MLSLADYMHIWLQRTYSSPKLQLDMAYSLLFTLSQHQYDPGGCVAQARPGQGFFPTQQASIVWGEAARWPFCRV